MSANIERTLLAHKWKINRGILGDEVYGKFRSLQISAYLIERILNARHINPKAIHYHYKGNSTFLKVALSDSDAKKFNNQPDVLWRYIYEELPLHKNDRWNPKLCKPVVSNISKDELTGDLILLIKFNEKSVRYIFPYAYEFELNDGFEGGSL